MKKPTDSPAVSSDGRSSMQRESSAPGQPTQPSSPDRGTSSNLPNALAPVTALWEYWIDAAQRTVIYWDVMRQRGNQFQQHEADGAPPVLVYNYETLIDGRTLDKPVNYSLLRIIPGPEHTIDPGKRPFVIVDPRAGHGPGIGGSKEDSQIGVALRAGHPVYFVSFHPIPEPDQTLVDVGRAEALFLMDVAARHPDSAKPCVIGNCQAGWAVAMLASVAPDLMGPIVLNGAPLSYWAGSDEQNPMRYLGGIWGGAWITSLLCDMGYGRFDGANLVLNFENLNPANTLWSKQYNLYSKVDTEAERYLNFEKWWTGFFQLTTEEMEFIVDNLFVGNKLGTSQITLPSGRTVQLKDIKAPIVVFASGGDNITPPQQALNWILDVYSSDQEIIKDNQVIVYTLNADIGHLGIFVSGQVARKEHTALIGTMDFIDLLPPGLYEMLIESTDTPEGRIPAVTPDYKYQVRFVERSLTDIHRLDDTRADEQYFESLATISDYNTELYKTFVRPWVQSVMTAQAAEMFRQLHPLRVQNMLVSDRNPFMLMFKPLADLARANRRPVSPDNPFVTIERNVSRNIVIALDAYRDLRDSMSGLWFKALYGPAGIGALLPPAADQRAQVESEAERDFQARAERLRSTIDQGGFVEAVARMGILLSRADRDVVPGTLILLRQALAQHPRLSHLSIAEFHAIHQDQFLILYLDRDRAIATLPGLVPSVEERREALDTVIDVVLAGNKPNQAEAAVLDELENVLDIKVRVK